MINLTYIHIATIAVVPCSAVGALSYIGYQYFSTNSSSQIDLGRVDDALTTSLSNKQLQLKNLESLIKTKDSLLEVEEAKKTKLEAELDHFEVAKKLKIKGVWETKKEDFERDAKAKEQHDELVATTTNEKNQAETDKNNKKTLVDNKKQEIDDAGKAHAKQLEEEQKAEKTKKTSEDAFKTANNNYEEQVAVETTAQKAVDANTQEISKQQATLGEKQTKNKISKEKQNQAETIVTSGLATCNTAIETALSGKTCDDDSLSTDDATASAAINLYQGLKTTLKAAKDEVNTLTASLEEVQKLLTTAQDETAVLALKLSEATKEKERLLGVKNTAENKKTIDNQAYEVAKALTTKLQTALSSVEKELEPLTNSLNAAKLSFDNLETQLNELNKKTATIHSAYDTSKAALSTIIGEINNNEKALTDAKNKIDELTQEIQGLQASLKQEFAPSTLLTDKTLQEINQLIDSHKKTLNTTKLTIEAFNKEKDLLKAQKTSITLEIDNTSKEIGTAE